VRFPVCLLGFLLLLGPAVAGGKAETTTVPGGQVGAAGGVGSLDYREADAFLRGDAYTYQSGGRDPFAPLVRSGDGKEEEKIAIADPGVADLILVGRAWGGGQLYALAETSQGMGLLLREGDRVRDGRVVSITPEGVVFSQTTYGVTRQITLPVGSVEEGRDER